MSKKLDWGSALLGVMWLLIGAMFMWRGRSSLLYHIPIYYKGPSWLNPWLAIIAGGLLMTLGLFAIASALQNKSGK